MQTTQLNSKVQIPNPQILQTRIKMLVLMNDEAKQLSFAMCKDIARKPQSASDNLVKIYLDHYEKKLTSAASINNYSKALTCAMLHGLMFAEMNYNNGKPKRELRNLADKLHASYFAKITRASIEGEAA